MSNIDTSSQDEGSVSQVNTQTQRDILESFRRRKSYNKQVTNRKTCDSHKNNVKIKSQLVGGVGIQQQYQKNKLDNKRLTMTAKTIREWDEEIDPAIEMKLSELSKDVGSDIDLSGVRKKLSYLFKQEAIMRKAGLPNGPPREGDIPKWRGKRVEDLNPQEFFDEHWRVYFDADHATQKLLREYDLALYKALSQFLSAGPKENKNPNPATSLNFSNKFLLSIADNFDNKMSKALNAKRTSESLKKIDQKLVIN